ncbi:MAG: cyclic nucleotide-binding domain-containing protein [Deltaproteobacteria bacterium]|nr:MAG: cyclic nucleotide-binding domain-containing protein [Deltaproteobacteria bacterium]
MSSQISKLLEEQNQILLKAAQQVSFHKGQVIFYEGHLPYGVYWVKNGQVCFSHQGSCDEKHDLKPPDSVREQWLGLHEYLESSSHCCTCVAETDCDVLFVNRTLLHEVLQGNPEINHFETLKH